MAVVQSTGTSSVFQVIPSRRSPVSFPFERTWQQAVFSGEAGLLACSEETTTVFPAVKHPDCLRLRSGSCAEERIRNRMFS